MADTPKDYQPLRDAHQQALDALNSHIDQTLTPAQDAGDRAPTRPEGIYRQSEGWPMAANMPDQNRAANRQFEKSQEHQAALHALNQHIDRPNAGEGADKTQDVARTTPEPDIER